MRSKTGNTNLFMDPLEKLYWHKHKYLEYMVQERKSSANWRRQSSYHIKQLYAFMAQNNLDDLDKVQPDLLYQFQSWLYQKYLLSKHTMRCYIVSVRMFFTYLYLNSYIRANPAQKVKSIDSPNASNQNTRGKRYYNWNQLIKRLYKDHRRKGLSLGNWKQKHSSLKLFIQFLNSKKVKSIYRIKPVHLEKYKQYLKQHYRNSESPVFMQVLKLQHACWFLKYFYYKSTLDENPAAEIDCAVWGRQLAEEIPPAPSKPEPKIKLDLLLDKYLRHRKSLGYSPKYCHRLVPFREFLVKKNITDPLKVTKQLVLEFQGWLFTRRKQDGGQYAHNTQLEFLYAVNTFYMFLIKYELAAINPAAGIDYPKPQDPLPREAMTHKEASRLLEAADICTLLGLRDRAIMEVLYSTGMRANELCYLVPEDVNLSQGYVRVTKAKGGPSFQRVVPVGGTACDWIKKYLEKVRPVLEARADQPSKYLFLTRGGRQFESACLNGMITKRYLYKTGLRKNIGTHSWRATCAVLMLKNGADLRYVQEQLGHHCISSTQTYTRLIPQDLKKIHRRCHPQEKKQRRQNAEAS